VATEELVRQKGPQTGVKENQAGSRPKVSTQPQRKPRGRETTRTVRVDVVFQKPGLPCNIRDLFERDKALRSRGLAESSGSLEQFFKGGITPRSGTKEAFHSSGTIRWYVASRLLAKSWLENRTRARRE
jgi:hypothetical protein